MQESVEKLKSDKGKEFFEVLVKNLGKVKYVWARSKSLGIWLLCFKSI